MVRAVVYNKIIDILADWDLDWLIDIGCPHDEYAPEAGPITDFVMNNYDKHLDALALADNIQLVFMRYLGCFPAMEDCIAIAHEILDYIN